LASAGSPQIGAFSIPPVN